MKNSIFKVALFGMFSLLTTTSLMAQSDTVKTKKVEINYGLGIKIGAKKDSTKMASAGNARFVGGITFTRFDIGYAKLLDNGSLTLSPANNFLDYRPSKTSTVSFDVLQMGYRFNNRFKAYVAAGFDWTLIRLNKDITIQKNSAKLEDYIVEPIAFSKNRFSSSYVHFPLNFELRSKEDNSGRRFRFIIGPEVAFLLGGKVKQISEERGKVKVTDNYHFAPFRYGGTARFGYGGLGAFVKYSASDMFDTPAQKGLNSMAFGLTFGLN